MKGQLGMGSLNEKEQWSPIVRKTLQQNHYSGKLRRAAVDTPQ